MYKIVSRIFSVLAILLVIYPIASYGQMVNTITIDGNRLMASKNEVQRNNPRYINALRSLVKEAELALTRGPYSVTFKEDPPSNVSANDYYSLSRYWWPDSTKQDGLP